MRNPIISVIIPFKGRLNLVCDAIRSVLLQSIYTPTTVEIITVEEKDQQVMLGPVITKQFPQIQVLINEEEEGPGGSRNTGLKVCRGKYIVFLDSDDILKSDYLINMLNAIRKGSEKAAVICLSTPNFHKDYKLYHRIRLYPLLFIRDISLLSMFIFNRKMLLSSAFYLSQLSHIIFDANKIRRQKFNYDYRRGGEDWDFILQTFAKGKISILPKKLLIFNYFPGSSTDDPVNRKLKWNSYKLLTDRLDYNLKKGLFYNLFLYYIRLFRG